MQLWDVDNFKKTGQAVERYPQKKFCVRKFGLLIFILRRCGKISTLYFIRDYMLY